MADNRAAILTGAKAAHTLHRDLGIKEQIERAGGGRVDVFGAIAKLGATLMFQPLDKLLGAYLPGDELGVLITTKRPLPVQRFTGAHELGHLYMGMNQAWMMKIFCVALHSRRLDASTGKSGRPMPSHRCF